MARQNQAKIEFKAVTSEFTNGIRGVNSSLKTMQNELKLNSAQLKGNGEDASLLTQRQQILQRQYDATTQKIELTQRSLEEAKRLLGENSTEYRNLENSLLRARTAQQNIQNELNQTSRRLEDLENSANDAEQDVESLSRELNDLGDSASNSEGGFTTLKGAISTFAGNVLTSAVSKIGELSSQLLELNEETKEFRMNIAKLDGSTSQYGYSTEFTNKKMKELYGYFQDDQVAVNTISNLQGMGLTEKELNNTLSASIAVWTAYGDSIPIEGLTESVNETAQVGKVTGSLADALNWAGISEDDFNKRLEKCNSTKERAQLITDTLNGAYGKSKETYDKNTESLRKNNEANYELIDAQARLGEAIEPVDTAITNLKASALEAIEPVIKQVANGINGLIKAFNGLPQEAKTTIVAVTAIATGIVVLIGVAGAISSAWGVITGIFSAGINVFAGVGGAIAAISPPILIAVGVIGALIAIGIALYKNWDTIKVKATEIWNNISNTVSNAWNGIKTKATEIWTGIKNVIVNIWEGIKTVFSTVLEVVKVCITTYFNFYKTIINTALNVIKTVVTSIWNGIKTVFTTVLNVIKTVITTYFNFYKTIINTALNVIKTVVTSIWNGIKTVFTTVLNGIKTIITMQFNAYKTAISNIINATKGVITKVWNGIKSVISTVCSGITNIVSNKFNSIKNTISNIMNGAKNIVSNALNKIEGFFSNCHLSLPKIKVPSFSITGKLSINPPSVPHIGVTWKYLAQGGILTNPTLFGMSGNTGLVGGEKGPKLLGHYKETYRKNKFVNSVKAKLNNIEKISGQIAS